MDDFSMVSLEDVRGRATYERGWWEGVLAARSESEMETSGFVADWSFKDLVAHLNGWRRRSLDQLTASKERRDPPPDFWPAELNQGTDDEQLEKINAWIQAQGRAMSLDDVLETSRAQWSELYQFITSTSVQDLNDSTLFPYLEGQSLGEAVMTGSLFDHVHDEHGDDVQRWLEKS